MGWAVVSDVARIAGAASIPGPITEAASEFWFVWQGIAERFQFASASGLYFNAGRQDSQPCHRLLMQLEQNPRLNRYPKPERRGGVLHHHHDRLTLLD